MPKDNVRPATLLREDRQHGSAWLSYRALEILRDRAAAGAAWADLWALAMELRTARPDMPAIMHRVNRALAAAREPATAEALRQAAGEILGQAQAADEAAARRAASFVAGRRVFSLSRSGTVLAALRLADPAPTMVVLAESRPGGEGRAVAEELARQGQPVTLVADAAVAEVFARELVEVMLVGADAVLRSGHVVNKIGTRAAATFARQYHVPVYAACATDKIRLDEAAPEDAIEPTALYDGDAPLDVFTPLFDVTPARLLTGLITEDGILAAADVGDVAFELKILASRVER